MINDSSDRSRVLSKVYMQIIKVKDSYLRDQLELLIGDDLNSFYEENANSLKDPKLWNYIIKQTLLIQEFHIWFVYLSRNDIPNSVKK